MEVMGGGRPFKYFKNSKEGNLLPARAERRSMSLVFTGIELCACSDVY